MYDISVIEPYKKIRAWVNNKMSGRNPPLYCTNTMIVMQGHQTTLTDRRSFLCVSGQRGTKAKLSLCMRSICVS